MSISKSNINKIKELYLLCLSTSGISQTQYELLTKQKQNLLEKQNDRYFLKQSARKKIKVVLTGGAFDVLHMGHLYTLEAARKYGDVLIVAVARDEQILRKGREPIHPQEYRTKIVNSLKVVDLAISGFDKIQKMLDLVKPDTIVYGYDQQAMQLLPPYDNIKTVKLFAQLDETKYKSGKIIEKLGI